MAGLYVSYQGMVGPNSAICVYVERCVSVGSSHHGSLFAVAGIGIAQRPSPPFRYSFSTSGPIAYLRNSSATSTFFAPLGMTGPNATVARIVASGTGGASGLDL